MVLARLWAVGALGLACSGPAPRSTHAGPSVPYRGGDAPLSQAADHIMLTIPAGQYIAGSTPEDRERAYVAHRETSGTDSARARGQFEHEQDRHVARLPVFRIDQQPVTQAAYAEFVRDIGTAAPTVDRDAWAAITVAAGTDHDVHDFDTRVASFLWRDDTPPAGREDHPVVLVSVRDARRYCAWRGAVVGQVRRLPTAAEFEKAARGAYGRVYPWGHEYRADMLNDRVAGPDDTMASGSFSEGASEYGMLDAAGNVMQWTATPFDGGDRARDAALTTVKGSAWDEYAGVGRGAARRGFTPDIRHITIGFRCAANG